MVTSPSPVCIICKQQHLHETVEHIIPQSLGNVHYILRKGLICARCNQRFSRYENRVVSSINFIKERRTRGYQKNRTEDLKTLLDADALFVLLKITYESLYQSRPKIFNQLNHRKILSTLHKGERYPHPLIKNKVLTSSKAIPNLIDRWRLKRIGVSLQYSLNPTLNRCNVEWRYGEISFITYLNLK